MQYRKKPVVIEAWRNGSDEPKPQWLLDAIEEGQVHEPYGAAPAGSLTIETLEGDHRADPDDWIIQGVQGELYPCKPDIFEATYEAVD